VKTGMFNKSIRMQEYIKMRHSECKDRRTPR